MQIYIEEWQHECSGDLFAVGDPVTWQAVERDLDAPPPRLDPDVLIQDRYPVDGYPPTRPISGIVRRIQVVAVPERTDVNDEVYIDIPKSPRWLDEVDKVERANLHPLGMLVDLDER